MKIAVDIRSATKISGIGVATHSMLKHLLALDQTNEYLLISGQDKKTWPANCKIIPAPYTLTDHPRGDFWFHVVLPSLLEKEGVDVFWGPGFQVPFWGRFRKLVTFHDLSFEQQRRTFPLLTRLYFSWVYRLGAHAADRVLPISEFTKSEIGRFYGPRILAKSQVIPLDCDEIFRTPALAIEETREKYGLDRPYILFVGNLEPRKNLTSLVQAFHVLRRESKNAYVLAIVGQKAWMYSDILKSIRGSDLEKDVKLLGYVSLTELHNLYAGAQLFAFPSLYEGFGIPLLEAMASGVPVLAARRASIPEVVGDAAILVDPENIPEFANAIQLGLESLELRDTLRAKGIERIKRFSWSASAAMLLKEFEACG